MRFVLASASPARLETLRRAGLAPEVIVSGLDESAIHAPTTEHLVAALAAAKLQAVLDAHAELVTAVVLACDSLLEIDGTPYGKPGDAATAAERWQLMRGRSGTLHTGHALHGPRGLVQRTASTVVHFADLDADEIARYAASGEPETVAGAFTLDGLGGWFVTRVEGDPHNVVGVSLPVLRLMLREQGVGLADLGYPTR